MSDSRSPALWIAMLFLFAYGDTFGLFAPGRIEEIMSGEISGIEITDVFLFAVSAYIAIASVMVFLTLVLNPAVCRLANVVLAILTSARSWPRRSVSRRTSCS